MMLGGSWRRGVPACGLILGLVSAPVRAQDTGNQVNANFGKANQARSPRIMQASLRFTF